MTQKVHTAMWTRAQIQIVDNLEEAFRGAAVMQTDVEFSGIRGRMQIAHCIGTMAGKKGIVIASPDSRARTPHFLLGTFSSPESFGEMTGLYAISGRDAINYNGANPEVSDLDMRMLAHGLATSHTHDSFSPQQAACWLGAMRERYATITTQRSQ